MLELFLFLFSYWMYERRRINIMNVYVIGSVGSILQEEQIENIAFKYEQIGCEVEYVKKVSDNLTFDLIKDCFNKIGGWFKSLPAKTKLMGEWFKKTPGRLKSFLEKTVSRYSMNRLNVRN